MLERISEKTFEIAGTFFGGLASLSIASQVHKEITTEAPSTVSVFYATGFLVIFLFWTLYGIRFGRIALWLTNGIALVMQAALLVVVLGK